MAWLTSQKYSLYLRLGLLLHFLLFSQPALAGSLKLSWSPIPSSALAGYKVKFGTSSGSYSQSLSVGNVTSYTLQNLTDGVRYYLVVAGHDASNVEGLPSAEVSGVVLSASSVAASSITSSSATVSWATNKASYSQVEYGTTTAYGSSSPLSSTLVTNHSVSLTNLNPGVTYNYRVRSVDEGGSVHVSANFTFTTVAPLTSSAISAGGITSTSAVITWTTNRLSNSQVEYGTSTAYGFTTPLDSILVSNHSQMLTNLTPGMTYNYRIRSTDANGAAHTSGNFSFTTGGPLSSSNIAATLITSSSAAVGWTTNNPSSSQVEYGTTTSYGLTTLLDSSLVVNHSQALTNLTPGTTYNYRIRSVDASGATHVSGNFSFTTITATTLLAINAGGDAVAHFGADTGFSGGIVENGQPIPIDATDVTNPAPDAVYQTSRWGTSFSYTFSNLTPSASYYVRLHFSENYWTSVSQRRFHVALNGTQVLNDFDILAATGQQFKACIQQFRAVASGSGQIIVQYSQGSADVPTANGLELVPTSQVNLPVAELNVGGGVVGTYQADPAGLGGNVRSVADAISTTGVLNPAPQEVYQSERWGSDFSYTVSNLTANASYLVRLHFAEIFWSSAGQRRFNVSINGMTVLKDFDIIATAGAPDKAVVREFVAIPNSSRALVVRFTSGSADMAKASGVQVVPLMPVVAVNAGGSAKGSFVSDAYYSGGSASVVSNTVDTSAVTPAVPKSIYGSNRTGTFSYTIPNLVPGAVYQVRLHFAETSDLSASRRRFNLSINGTKVLSNFDIVSVAGSVNKAVVVPFICVADSSGKVVLQFSGKFGSAKVNAIEVLK